MPGPGDEPAAGARGQGHMRAARADREQVIDVLKTAFVHDRLTKNELDARVGRALAARTYADLDALTADIPAGPNLAPSPEPARTQTRPGNLAGNRSVNRAFKSGVGVITVMTLATSVSAGVVDGPATAAGVVVILALLVAIATGFVASVLAGVLMLESRQRKRPPGRLPPRSASGAAGLASRRPRGAAPRLRGGGPALASGCSGR
jgi:hypothetical protein